MSDQEAIIQTLRKAESRIRINRFVRRMASGLSLWIGIAVLMKTWDLVSPFSGLTVRVFWTAWWLGLTVFVLISRSAPRRLGLTATEVDRKAQLKDELLSAYWFLTRQAASPWVDLQVQRAARKAADLDLTRLFPRVVPRTFYLAAIGLVLLLALSFSPLPFAPTAGFSEPAGTSLSPADALVQEIEGLLAAAERLRPDTALSEFQEVMESLEGLTLSPAEADRQLGAIQDRVTEGNLSVSNLVEGLEELGADLTRSADTEAAGQSLSEGDLGTAAGALSELGAELGMGRRPAEDLQSTLERAGGNSYSGLEQLAGALGDAAAALESRSSEAVEQALEGAAQSLAELADLVESQQLRNQAAERMESLQDLLQQQAAQAQADAAAETQGERIGGLEAGQREAGSQPGAPGDSMPQTGMTDGAQPGSADSSSPGGEAEAASADLMSSPAGELGDVGAGGGGETPLGIGFSPGPVEGPPTSLEVQLQEELVEAPSANAQESSERQEEASRREQSTLDYRNVPSELTRAQQDLLNQDRIPRAYRNLIRDYFEAIRGDTAP